MNGSDLWYYSSYDERWRMVATYRGSDADPKERFVHHQAGASGDGGSSYIDLVAFRERDVDDGWTGDPDGTVDERLYYCQNQHADVVALITAAGAQREMARYSAYGVPFGLPVGDVNSDGACLQADQNQVRDWALATPAVYDVRGDLDLDGDVDLTDRDTLRDKYKGVTLGRGVLSASAMRNQRGVAGYVSAGYEPSTYLIRHRVFPSELGVWASRDPLQYRDSLGLSQFAGSRPQVNQDAFGLTWCKDARKFGISKTGTVPCMYSRDCSTCSNSISMKDGQTRRAWLAACAEFCGAFQTYDGKPCVAKSIGTRTESCEDHSWTVTSIGPTNGKFVAVLPKPVTVLASLWSVTYGGMCKCQRLVALVASLAPDGSRLLGTSNLVGRNEYN